jgi:hypothetical protein
VIVFSNHHQDERCLVIFHNRFASTSGWIKMSVAFAGEDRPGGARSLLQKNLGQGLGLRDELGWFVAFRDLVSGLEYIRCSRDLFAQGLSIELNAYQTHVFLDFREMAEDAGGHLARLTAYLHGRGVTNLEKAGREISLQPLHNALRELCQPDILARQLEVFHGRPGSKKENALWQELEAKIGILIFQAAALARTGTVSVKAAEAAIEDLLALRSIFRQDRGRLPKVPGISTTAKKYLQEHFREHPQSERLLILWIYVRRATGLATEKWPSRRFLFSEWQLDAAFAEILRNWGVAEAAIYPSRQMVVISCTFAERIAGYVAALDGVEKNDAAATGNLVRIMLDDGDVQSLLQVNRYQNDLFFNRENFIWFCDWLTILIQWELYCQAKKARRDDRPPKAEVLDFMNYLPALAAQAEYKLEVFLEKLERLALN